MTKQSIINSYVKLVRFLVWHRIVFFLASTAVAFWFLCPLFFPDSLSIWIWVVTFLPILVWNIIALPKDLMALTTTELSGLWFRPFLHLKCGFYALKPTSQEKAKYPWLPFLFILSFAGPFICFCIVVTFIVLRELSI